MGNIISGVYTVNSKVSGLFYIILFGLVSTFLLLFAVGDEIIEINSTITNGSRLLFAVIGPFIIFLSYILVTYILINHELEEPNLQDGFVFVTLMGVIGILFAIAISSRLSLITQLFIFQGIDPRTLIFVIVGIIAPVIEEFVKGLPLLFLIRVITINRDGNERRLYTNPKVFILFGILSGAIFNILETLNYLWATGSIFDMDTEKVWFNISRQVLLRSINPLHMLTTVLMALGIFYFYANSTSTVMEGNEILSFFSGYVAAVIIHGLWNGSLALQDQNTKMISLFGVDLPLFNAGLFFVVWVVLIATFWSVLRIDVQPCSKCGEWHDPNLKTTTHSEDLSSEPKFSLHFSNKQHTCENCDTAYTQKRCPNCATTKTFVCSFCKYPYPVYENRCWNCENPVQPVFNDVFEFGESKLTDLGLSFLLLFAGIYLPYGLALIFILRGSNIPSLDQLLVSVLLYLMIGLAMVFAYFWSKNERTYELATLIGRYLLVLLLLQFGTFLIILGFVLLIQGYPITSLLIAIGLFLILAYSSFKILQHQIVVIGNRRFF